jgi:NTE family protein
VLAGGGARGAYEIGALSELLPALPGPERPQIVVGTSVGAINAAYLAASAHQPLDKIIQGGEQLWREIRYEQVLEPILSVQELRRVGSYLGGVIGVRGARLDSLLDPSPLTKTLTGFISFKRLQRNVSERKLRAVAVVATSGLTNLSVVFHQGGRRPRRDVARGIDYVRTELAEHHVLASAAIPTFFPAAEIPGDGREGGWYFDGGTRLNTPIKPALELGAKRLIMIALNSLVRRSGGFSTGRRPDALDGAGQLVQAVLVDPLVNDVHTLATINELLDDEDYEKRRAHEERTGRSRVPYILIAPDDPDEIGALAAEIYREHYGSLRKALRSTDIAAIGRLLDGGASPVHGELLSYLLFAPEFLGELIELGKRDARRWLDEEHDDGLWQLARLKR